MGTTKISVMIAEVNGGVARVIGAGIAPADGMKQGVVVDIDRAAASVLHAVREAEQMAGTSVRVFHVGAAGEHIRSMNSRGVVAISGVTEEIGEDDVERAIGAARKFSLPADREIIHTLPQEFIVDAQSGIRRPAGMYGTRLEARVHVVTASRAALDNVAKVMDLAGVETGEIVLEPLASARAVLSDDERGLGVLMLDIGGGTTDVIAFVEGGVVASGVIGLGGNNITADVAYGLRASPQHAEEIKVRHGCALSQLVHDDEVIEVNTVGFRGSRRLGRQLLTGIIEPRVQELLSLIQVQVSQSGLMKSLGAGVVITGGTALLVGIRELAEQVFDVPVRIGLPLGVEGLSEVVSHPRFATGVGLLLDNSTEGAAVGSGATGVKSLVRSMGQFKRMIASFV